MVEKACKPSAHPLDVDYLRPVFWWRVEIRSDDECWLWGQSTGSHGYGQTWDGRTVRLAHRVAWVLTFGEIPTGMTVDHICRERKCCNPEHLRLLTNVQNASDNGFKGRTHCLRGHEFTEANTRTNSRGHRTCKACDAVRWRENGGAEKQRARRARRSMDATV